MQGPCRVGHPCRRADHRDSGSAEAPSAQRQGIAPLLEVRALRWVLVRTGPAASVIVEGGGLFTSPGTDRPCMQIYIAPATVICGGHTRMPGKGFTVNSTFLHPESVGTVRLAWADTLDDPLIDSRYLIAPGGEKGPDLATAG